MAWSHQKLGVGSPYYTYSTNAVPVARPSPPTSMVKPVSLSTGSLRMGCPSPTSVQSPSAVAFPTTVKIPIAPIRSVTPPPSYTEPTLASIRQVREPVLGRISPQRNLTGRSSPPRSPRRAMTPTHSQRFSTPTRSHRSRTEVNISPTRFVYSPERPQVARVVSRESPALEKDTEVQELQREILRWRGRAEAAESALGSFRFVPKPLSASIRSTSARSTTAAQLYDPDSLCRGMARLEKALPIVYTLYTNTGGRVGPELRAIVEHGKPPPAVTGTDAKVLLRGQGRPITEGVTKEDPMNFPVDVYYVKLEAGREYAAGTLTFAGRRIPRITSNPVTWAVLGDTGLRVKKAEKQFQPLDTWPARRIGYAQAEENPDLVVHMGDYIYREGPGEEGCASITETAEWGHTMFCWYAEFFEPFQPLLAAAPWIAARGNHENKKRMGLEWHFLLGSDDWDHSCNWDAEAETWCPHNHKPFIVEFMNSVVYSADNGDHHEQSIDHYNFKDAKLAKNAAKRIVIDPDTNFHEDIQAYKDDAILMETYSEFSKHAAKVAAAGKATFLLQHIPAFGVVCDGANWVGYNPNVQRSFWKGWENPSSLKAILSGHMHWYQRWSGNNSEVYMPTQFVIGNSGTMLIPECGIPPKGFDQTLVLQKKVNGSKHKAEIPIDGLIVRNFGYSMFRQEAYSGRFRCIHYVEDGRGSFMAVDDLVL